MDNFFGKEVHDSEKSIIIDSEYSNGMLTTMEIPMPKESNNQYGSLESTGASIASNALELIPNIKQVAEIKHIYQLSNIATLGKPGLRSDCH